MPLGKLCHLEVSLLPVLVQEEIILLAEDNCDH